MAEAKVKLTKKGDKDKVPSDKIGKGKKPTMSDVEGQATYWTGAICWNCWAVNDVVADTNVWLGYYCWNCGAYFEV
jgi:hypothetical protein